MEEKKVKIARYRKTDYHVNYSNNGFQRRYKWLGSTSNKYDVKEIPKEIFDWLQISSVCFQNGELVPIEDNDKEIKEEFEMNIDTQKLKNNVHTYDEIKKILEGNTNTMKKKLDKITLQEEKQFVAHVAKDLKIDSIAKINFIKEWSGIDLNLKVVDEE